MATENITYKDALAFKKNNCYSTANTFFEGVKSQPLISDFLKPNTKTTTPVLMIIIIFQFWEAKT